jgi:nickel/cobalt transporter (NiCoT) family protein
MRERDRASANMHSTIAQSPGTPVTSLQKRLVAIYALLIAGNVLAWVAAVITFRGYPMLLGTAFLAYTFGLRHAVDPDHIAAIDNVTRKLMQEGQRPVAVGFYFSLGHSTVVVLASAAIALTTVAFEEQLRTFRDIGGIVGTSVSALFLFVIAGANIVILMSVYRTFRRVRGGGRYDADDGDRLSMQTGLLGRLLRPVFAMVARSWHMYPLGLLFGLGFDTATEIGLLGISATEASKGLPIWSIMVFPALFTAGMSLVDTTDGVLMLGAYGWAFKTPMRKLYYNLTITAVSVLVALVIGTVEVLWLIADKLDLQGAAWSFVIGLNEQFGILGYLIIAVFAASWLGSTLLYRLRRYEQINAA